MVGMRQVPRYFDRYVVKEIEYFINEHIGDRILKADGLRIVCVKNFDDMPSAKKRDINLIKGSIVAAGILYSYCFACATGGQLKYEGTDLYVVLPDTRSVRTMLKT